MRNSIESTCLRPVSKKELYEVEGGIPVPMPLLPIGYGTMLIVQNLLEKLMK